MANYSNPPREGRETSNVILRFNRSIQVDKKQILTWIPGQAGNDREKGEDGREERGKKERRIMKPSLTLPKVLGRGYKENKYY